MSADPNLGKKLAEERRRRRKIMSRQNKSLNDYQVDSKYSAKERKKANKMAYLHADNLNDKIDASLDRSLQMMAHTAQTGASTAEMLDNQRNQIRRIHKTTHDTEEVLQDSTRSMQTVSSWKKGIGNWFRGSRAKKEYKGMSTDKISVPKQPNKSKKKKDSARYDNRRMKDEKWNKKLTTKERKEAQEEKINEIDVYMDELMGMATAIGQEMNDQNEMINETHESMKDLDEHFEKKNRYMKRIMKK